MASEILVPHIEDLQRIFLKNNRYESHEQSTQILKDLAKDKKILHEIVKKNLSQPDFLFSKRINPVIALTVEENKDFSLAANVWLPLPKHETTITHQSIHHHGNLLLTSITSFGNGYESIIFKKGFQTNKDTGETSMEMEKIFKHKLHNMEFVDIYQPHVVFFPKELSVTYALWSKSSKNKFDHFKENSTVQKYKSAIKNFVKYLGISSFFNINTIEDFDFCVNSNKLYAMKNRINYIPGTNENFVQNFFHTLQQISFKDYEFIEQLKNNLKQTNNTPPNSLQETETEKWINAFLSKEKIKPEFYPNHLNIDKVNLKREEILNYLQK